jgi:hypothetical protein
VLYTLAAQVVHVPLFCGKTSPVFSKVDNQRFWLEAVTCRCSVTSLAVSPRVVRLKTASHRIAATRLQRESSKSKVARRFRDPPHPTTQGVRTFAID